MNLQTKGQQFNPNLQESVKSGPSTEKVRIAIDNQIVDVPAGTTILEVATQLGIFIPTLCSHPDLDKSSVCRMCVVEVAGMDTLQTSCDFKIVEPITVYTNTPKVLKARANIIDMLFSKHCGFWDHLNCPRSGNCELQELAKFGTSPLHFGINEYIYGLDESSYAIVRDMDKCILCRRCVQVCQELQGVGCLEVIKQDGKPIVSTFMDLPLGESICINCGQCVDHCPTAALHTNDSSEAVLAAIADPDKHVVIQTAPAPRAAIGECFELEPGRALTFEMNTALRKVGFDKVFDTNFSADLTIMEEGTELIERLYKALVEKDPSAALPQFTSCSPGWIKYLEHFYPEFIPNLSSAKSPQQMFGAVIKTHYAELAGIDPKDIVTVALMPCTAKKFECNRPEMNSSGFQDVNYALTTVEMANLFKNQEIYLPDMEKSDFDDPFGTATGSGVIFGATGGVMESALRTVIELVTGEKVEQFFQHADIKPVRGMEGVRKAEVTIPKTGPVPALLQNVIPSFDWLEGATLKVAIAHGTENARKVIENIKAGGELASFHFIEFMACPGGCLGGGGQPIPTTPEIREARARALYSEDNSYSVRKSHENPAVLKLYEEFLTEGPCGHLSHELLHTSYTERGKYIEQIN
jgi:NADH-quinone oxidoreductase subunit G/[NiFe] hydrogenase diaphorase moiety small subunit